ncbi:unnamed protein product [Symbiodinium natans]|uniref:Uncharacterized protein n=1 Tax=Symbiodinium natans TaxID=878477 RepID=A0A812ILY6_9DINO|nr:unnamed protein product [Symbiodinium natans]
MEPPTKRACTAACSLSSLRGTATAAVHADTLAVEEEAMPAWAFSTAEDVAPPLSLSTTFTVPDSGQGHIYSRISAPTRSRCETLLGSIEGSEEQPAHAVLYSSGLAAAFALFAHFLPTRVFISGGYHGTHQVLGQLQKISVGGRCKCEPLPSPGELASSLKSGDLIWLETPLNPSCDVADIKAYVAAARGCPGVHVAVDGTFAPPPLQRPLLLGADAVMHATTKSLAGHSDALGGAVCVASAEVADQLRKDRMALGSTPGSLEVWLLLRSLRTLHLRVQRQSATATLLAEWLQLATAGDTSHALSGLIHAVHHPSLKTHPNHAVAIVPRHAFGQMFLNPAQKYSDRPKPKQQARVVSTMCWCSRFGWVWQNTGPLSTPTPPYSVHCMCACSS